MLQNHNQVKSQNKDKEPDNHVLPLRRSQSDVTRSFRRSHCTSRDNSCSLLPNLNQDISLTRTYQLLQNDNQVKSQSKDNDNDNEVPGRESMNIETSSCHSKDDRVHDTKL